MRFWWLLFALGACVGSIGDADPDGGDGTSFPGDSSVGNDAFQCDADAELIASPMRRLSRAQYTGTLDEMLSRTNPADVDSIMATLSPALEVLPHDNSDDYRRLDQAATQPHTDGYYEVAVAVAAALTSSTARLTSLAGSCATDSNNANDASCVRDFVERFGALALRRPLVEDELSFYSADVYDDPAGVSAESFADRITVLLLAPQFLYLVEDQLPATADNEELFPLDPYELASRLSFHFWNRMPDEALFAAAADGSLATDDGYAAQVDRMFTHPRTRAVVDSFIIEWLRLEELPAMDASLGAPAYDAFVADDVPSAQLTQHMVEETLDLYQHYTWTTEGNLDDVLLSNQSFAKTPDLAAIYDVPVWQEGEEPPTFPEGQRGGLITRAAMVATGTTSTRPVMKGLHIRERLLCGSLPEPPDDLGDLPSLTEDMTVRESLDTLTAQPGTSCVNCHVHMNGLGYPTETYDPLGRFRTEEVVWAEDGSVVATKPVNSTAVPLVTDDDEREVSDGMQLSERLVESDQTASCMARHYFRFTYGREENNKADGCALISMRDALREGTFEDLLREAALQPQFKFRKR